jgi:hypothetical protein
VVASDALAEFIDWKKVHDLGEHCLALVHHCTP